VTGSYFNSDDPSELPSKTARSSFERLCGYSYRHQPLPQYLDMIIMPVLGANMTFQPQSLDAISGEMGIAIKKLAPLRSFIRSAERTFPYHDKGGHLRPPHDDFFDKKTFNGHRTRLVTKALEGYVEWMNMRMEKLETMHQDRTATQHLLLHIPFNKQAPGDQHAAREVNRAIHEFESEKAFLVNTLRELCWIAEDMQIPFSEKVQQAANEYRVMENVEPVFTHSALNIEVAGSAPLEHAHAIVSQRLEGKNLFRHNYASMQAIEQDIFIDDKSRHAHHAAVHVFLKYLNMAEESFVQLLESPKPKDEEHSRQARNFLVHAMEGLRSLIRAHENDISRARRLHKAIPDDCQAIELEKNVFVHMCELAQSCNMRLTTSVARDYQAIKSGPGRTL
jgi:hypothetical protein